MPTLHTTIKRLLTHTRGGGKWNQMRKLLRHLGKTEAEAEADDAPLPLTTILDSNGLDYALWCLRAAVDVERHTPEIRLYAVSCVRQVQHLLTDPRSLEALDVAERHAKGEATDAELAAAWDAAWRAARDAQATAKVDAKAWVYAAKAAAATAARDAAGSGMPHEVAAVARAAREAARDFGWYLRQTSPRSVHVVEWLTAEERALREQVEAFRRRFG
jgi:hypothetical protein